MKLKTFKKIIKTHRKAVEMIETLHSYGIDLIDGKFQIYHLVFKQMNLALSSHYDADGVEWIDWFINESEYGDRDYSSGKFINDTAQLVDDKTKENIVKDKFGAHDKDGNPIAFDIKSLWELLESDYKLKNKK